MSEENHRICLDVEKTATLFRHQSVVGPSCPHNLCFPQFQRCGPLSLELIPAFSCFVLSCLFLPHRPTFSRLLKTHCFDQTYSSP